MSIHHKKRTGLLPAPVLLQACHDIVFLEDVACGGSINIKLIGGVYPGLQVTLEYSNGSTGQTLTAPLDGGHASFLIPACAFIGSLWLGMRIRYWIDGSSHESEVLDLEVVTRL